MLKISFVKCICRFLPPLLAHRIQNQLIPNAKLQRYAISFSARSITGGILSGNTRDFLAEQFYFHGYFEWRNIVLVNKILEIKKGDIIEVGANIGTETISYANLNSHNVHAFEPAPNNFKCLKEIKKKNELQNLKLYNVLVADKEGFAYFEPPMTENSGIGFITKKIKETSLTISTVRLDGYLNDIKSCAAIIIDVEGFEFNVLRGGLGIIKRFRPFLILEVNPDLISKRSGYSVKDIYTFMEENAYQCFLIAQYSLTKIDINTFKKGSHVNWICIPQELSKYSGSLSKTLFINGFNPFFSDKIF